MGMCSVDINTKKERTHRALTPALSQRERALGPFPFEGALPQDCHSEKRSDEATVLNVKGFEGSIEDSRDDYA